MKSIQSDLIFIFIGLSETPNNFAKKCLLVKKKKGCQFQKTKKFFIEKETALKSINMQKGFLLIRATDW